ncbi:MAG: PhoH family protein [Oligoflexales bacterium]|nr:PhoH family protein [Oligoflexales bacterium]
MKKVFVLDTNVLLSGPSSLFKFDDNDVVIPISVIEEIDRFKKDQTETGRNAREVSRILDKLRQRGALSSGIALFEDRSDSGLLFVYLGHDMGILPELLADSADNHILAIALTLQKKFGDKRKVILITKDSNLRIKSDAFGITSEDFEADKVDISELYTGITHIKLAPESLHSFMRKGELQKSIQLPNKISANQFFVLENEESNSDYALGIYDAASEKIKLLPSADDNIWGVSPRNIEQQFGLHALLDDRFKLVTLSGGAGTGKTLLAIAAGLNKTTNEDIYQKLLVARPIFAMGQDLGYLPGDLDDKLNPWMQPIYDTLDFLLGGGAPARQKRLSKTYQELIHQGLLAIEPLTYIRGRSLPNAFFVIDESQNLTPHEIKTILTRAGEGTKIVLTGDPFQIDNPYIDSTNNGLTYVIERFKHAQLAAHITFKQGERSELATLAAELL